MSIKKKKRNTKADLTSADNPSPTPPSGDNGAPAREDSVADELPSQAVGTVVARENMTGSFRISSAKRGRRGHFLTEEGRQAAKQTILENYNAPGAMTAAAKAANVDLAMIHYWIEHDSEFAAGMAECDRRIDAAIEREIYRRGTEGIDRPLSYQGRLTGDSIREYSDNLLMFGAKKRMPEYRDNVTLTHQGHLDPEVKEVLGQLAAAFGSRDELPQGQVVDVIDGETVPS